MYSLYKHFCSIFIYPLLAFNNYDTFLCSLKCSLFMWNFVMYGGKGPSQAVNWQLFALVPNHLDDGEIKDIIIIIIDAIDASVLMNTDPSPNRLSITTYLKCFIWTDPGSKYSNTRHGFDRGATASARTVNFSSVPSWLTIELLVENCPQGKCQRSNFSFIKLWPRRLVSIF